ncbi:unnamed protein product [Closterium sp. Yama58-4]|nr:unnamed protein product [Closterium sp. Yama58-4]
MGFEVANVIVRAINLRQSLLERDIEDLRAEVLASEGIRMLVSDDFYHVWCIAAEDKRGELRAVARDVARLGKQCLDPALHSLTQAFDALGTMDGPKGRMTSAEVEGELRALEGQAQVTAELYHELANLEQLQQSLDRRMKQDTDSAVNRELIAQMRAELKAQEKIVKTMKKKGLWSKTMDEVVEKLVQVVIFLHDQIVDVFGADVVKVGRLMSGTPPTAADLRKLGVNGMALQYANIVNMIDTMVMRPACVETQREALYSALPASVCGRLKRTLLQSQDIEQESTESIRQKMEAVLDWLVTMAENTIRSVGVQQKMEAVLDWLVTMAENTIRRRWGAVLDWLVTMSWCFSRYTVCLLTCRFGLDSRVQGHTDLTLLQTLLQLPTTFFCIIPLPSTSLSFCIFPGYPPRFGLDSRVQERTDLMLLQTLLQLLFGLDTDLTLLQTLQHVDHLKMERLRHCCFGCSTSPDSCTHPSAAHPSPPPRFGLDSRVQGHTDLTLLQTLQHVDHLKMERLVLLLLVGLQHLASRSADNDWSPVPRGVVLAPVYSPRVLSPDRAGSSADGGAAGGSGGSAGGGDGVGVVVGDGAEAVAAAAGESDGLVVRANGEKTGETGEQSISAETISGKEGTPAAAAAPAAGLSAASEEASASAATDEFRFPVPKSSSVESQGAAEAAAAAAAATAAAGAAAGGGGGKEEEPVVPPISLSRARRGLSESVPTVDDWETLPRRIAAMEEEEKARAEEGGAVSAAAEGLGVVETGRPRSAGLEPGAVDAAGSAEPPVWRQVRQASLTEASLEPTGGGGGSRPSSSGGKPATAAASTTEVAESPAAAARRALASGMGTSRKSLENALRMGGNAGKRPVDAAGAFGSPFDRTKLPGSAAGSGAAGSGPLAGEALLAAMTMSQGFGPAARGAASEEMMEAMREATYGRSRSHTFAMAARPEPNPRFFTKSLSRYNLLRRMEAEEAGGGGGGGGGAGSSSAGGSIFVAPQRFLPMTPATVDVDRIHDVKPDLDLTSVAAPRLGGRLV